MQADDALIQRPADADGMANYLYAAAEKALPGQKIRKDMSDGDPDFESKFYILGHTACPAVLKTCSWITWKTTAS